MLLGRPNLGQILVSNGIISAEQLQAALTHQAKSRCRLGEALIALGFCTELEIARCLAEQLEIPFVNLHETPPLPSCVALLPREVALEFGVLPVRMEGNRLLVVARDPFDIRVDDAIRSAAGVPVILAIAPESQLHEYLQLNYSDNWVTEATETKDEATDIQEEDQSISVDQLVRAGEQVSTVRIVNVLIADAIRRGASDLHIEPEERHIRVRYRIDGHLRNIVTLSRSSLMSVVARIKIMTGMDIAESQKPQDGGCRVRVSGRAIEIRASTLRGMHGEKVVLRIQTSSEGLHDLNALGFEPEMLERLRRQLKSRQGMLLVAGPTGSCKTTTLYAMLNHLNQEKVNITTVEDPVEIQLAGVHQIQVNERAGRSFASALRAILRQDPDIIMVGEIRDVETTEIACRAALTGHLVISTIHTQHALGTVARLLDMGVAPWLVSACLNGVLAQRLVRRVCEECAKPYTPSRQLQQALESQFGSLANAQFRKGSGCPACQGMGTRGRLGVYELLHLDEEFRHLLAEGISSSNKVVLWEYARQRGFKTMEEDAFRKASRGLIPPEEVMELGFGVATAMGDSDQTPEPCASEATKR